MRNMIKGMILILVVMYVVSPVDACPGPIDDLIVYLAYSLGFNGGESS